MTQILMYDIAEGSLDKFDGFADLTNFFQREAESFDLSCFDDLTAGREFWAVNDAGQLQQFRPCIELECQVIVRNFGHYWLPKD